MKVKETKILKGRVCGRRLHAIGGELRQRGGGGFFEISQQDEEQDDELQDDKQDEEQDGEQDEKQDEEQDDGLRRVFMLGFYS